VGEVGVAVHAMDLDPPPVLTMPPAWLRASASWPRRSGCTRPWGGARAGRAGHVRAWASRSGRDRRRARHFCRNSQPL